MPKEKAMDASESSQTAADGGKFDQLKEGTFHEEFKEIEEVRGIIANLINIYEDMISVELAVEKFLFIIDQYQEQPHLLDPHLESLLAQLLDIVKDKSTPMEVTHLAFKLLYMVTKTRGYKVIVRLMPHEVADVEPLLSMLSSQSPSDHQTWETRYMLLIWLSIVCMIPFDMCRLDSNISGQGDEGKTKKPVMDRIIDAGRLYLDATDKSKDAAAYMLSKFMTRPDVRRDKLPEFLDWALVELKKTDRLTVKGMTKISAILSTFALLYKHGKREDLIDYGPTILEHVTDLNLKESNNTLLRKIATKLTQRIGLIFLKARVAAWRYQRGSRSLVDNLKTNAISQTGDPSVTEEEDEEYDIPDEMEDVIELLLVNLKDRDTIVRWSAAKGIGRVTGRLPRELADEVVASIMELFTITETDGAWHGGCLALAELGRRGLLLPHRLSDVVPIIIRALNYDERRGAFSVGSHVRDAACYVCWAFARAYDPEELKPHVHKISSALVIVSIFDREVNVRRAASAAFQENVGRQGQFPHGIDILTTCDYFAVGNRKTCYNELSVFVAQFKDYTQDMIDHLVNDKLSHWDMSMRELTADGLHKLVPSAPSYFIDKVLPTLIEKSSNMDLCMRHGAIISAGEVVYALSKLDNKKPILDVIGEKSISGLKGITTKLVKAQLFRGLGGDMMRQAVCSLVQNLALSKCPFHNDDIIDAWQKLIDECIKHADVTVQAAAIRTIPAFYEEYYTDSDLKPVVRNGLNQQEVIIEKLMANLGASLETTRIGHLSAMGAIPKCLLECKLKAVLTALTKSCTFTKQDEKMAESRSEAIKSITSVCSKVELDLSVDADPSVYLCPANIPTVYGALFEAMNDYTLDSRGDVGAWVREAAMSALFTLTSRLVKSGYKFSDEKTIKTLVCCLLQQAVEKIDRTRALAGELFSQLLYHDPQIPGVDHRAELQQIFSKENIVSIMKSTEGSFMEFLDHIGDDWAVKLNWAVPANTFPLFTAVLSLDSYAYSVLLGLTVSVGGLTESLVKSSVASLLAYLRDVSQDKKQLDRFSATLLKVCKDFQKVDRITIPMFKMIDQLMARDIFSLYAEEENHSFPVELYAFSKAEITKCGDPKILIVSINVFCDLLQFPGDIRKKTLLQLMIFLCHRFPLIRKTTANKLYETIVTFDELVDEDSLDEVMTLLSDTQWDKPIEEVKPIRNKLCDFFGVKQPVATKKPAAASGPSKQAYTG